MIVRPVSQPMQSTPRKIVLWDYFFQTQKERISVCQNCLCKVLDIGRKRIRVLQSKIGKKESLADNRGRHENRVIRFFPRILLYSST